MAWRLTGASEFGELARSARLAGGKLLPDMRKSLAKLGKPAKKAVQRSAEKTLPRSGGYALTMSRSLRIRTTVDTGYTTAGITITTYAAGRAQRRMIGAINRGVLRHPVYGHRRRAWVDQKVKAGFWDRAMEQVEDQAHEGIRAVLDDTIKTLTT